MICRYEEHEIMKKPLIIITGATSGIGLEAANLFYQRGYRLLLLGRNVKKLPDFNCDQVMVRSIDVTNLSAMKHAIFEAQEQFGPVDALLNIAGVMMLGDIATQDVSQWQTMLDANVTGVLNGMQSVLSGMRERGRGTIINVSSIAGIKSFPNHAAYSATKFAVCGLTENVREEVACDNIRVMTLSPGAVETPLLSHTTSEEIKL